MSDVFDAKRLFSELKAKARTFELVDGETFTVQHPKMWPDGTLAAARDGDLERLARLVLGDEQYDRFTGLGGTGGVLQDIVEELFGGSVGESSASSTS